MTTYCNNTTIEYGFDEKGNKVKAIDAERNIHQYKCPCCNEVLELRKGPARAPYFAHGRKSGRTPKQKMCPWYKGDDRYNNLSEFDKLSINNGGVPLYLCEQHSSKYQLRAVFPILSNNTLNFVNKWDIKVHISNSKSEDIFSAIALRNYPINEIILWNNIEFEGFPELPQDDEKQCMKEIKEKWGWGIRGIDVGNDLFHVHDFGGFRVAAHSNVVVGKDYYFLDRSQYTPFVPGVAFEKKGELRLSRQIYNVFSLHVEKATNEAMIYIQSRGYQLIEKNDSLIPIWPPAAIIGKEFIYRKNYNNSFVYHKKEPNQEIEVYNGEKWRMSETDNLIICNTHGRILSLKDSQYNQFSGEIRYIASQDIGCFYNHISFIPSLVCTNHRGINIPLDENIFKEKDLRFFSDESKIVILVLNKDYILLSSANRISCDRTIDRIIFLLDSLINIVIKKNNNVDSGDPIDIDIEAIVRQLYRIHSENIPLAISLDKLIDFAEVHSKDFLQLLVKWKCSRKIPYFAMQILIKLQEDLGL